MRTLGRGFLAGWTAAVLAVALLSFATVQSAVMQAAEGSPFAAFPICAADGGGVAAPLQGAEQSGKAKAAASCAFCAAAAHAPLVSLSPPIPEPTCVAWLNAPPTAPHGPRGPPAFRAKARAPPIFPETI